MPIITSATCSELRSPLGLIKDLNMTRPPLILPCIYLLAGILSILGEVTFGLVGTEGFLGGDEGTVLNPNLESSETTLEVLDFLES